MEPAQKPRLKMKPSIERILELFHYDPDTGLLSRAISTARGIEGQVFDSDRIWVDGVLYKDTHIMWVCYHRRWPADGYWIDHKDGLKANTKISNLREATPTQNQQNKAGYGAYAKGVTWRDRKLNPFQAKIRVNGVRIHLGSFSTEEEAAQAYQEACLKYHGEFACPA